MAARQRRNLLSDRRRFWRPSRAACGTGIANALRIATNLAVAESTCSGLVCRHPASLGRRRQQYARKCTGLAPERIGSNRWRTEAPATQMEAHQWRNAVRELLIKRACRVHRRHA